MLYSVDIALFSHRRNLRQHLVNELMINGAILTEAMRSM